MLLELQCYAWNGRSWNKGHEQTALLLQNTMGYLDFSFGGIPNRHPGFPSEEAMQARLAELIEKHQDEEGAIVLTSPEGVEPKDDGNGNMQVPLDEESGELLGLLQQHEHNSQLDLIANNAVWFSEVYLPEAYDNACGILVDEGASFLLDAIVNHEVDIADAFGMLAKAWEKAAVNGQGAKSHWKEYLRSHPELAQRVKDGEWIVETEDDGTPVFQTDFFSEDDGEEDDGAEMTEDGEAIE